MHLQMNAWWANLAIWMFVFAKIKSQMYFLSLDC